MDPLSGVLSLVKPHNSMCGGFGVGGDWFVPDRDDRGRVQEGL
jgi:hypothetical protein